MEPKGRWCVLQLIYGFAVQKPGVDLPGGEGSACPPLQGLLPPAFSRPCQAGMPAQPPCSSVLHPPFTSCMNLAVSWYLHANAGKTRRVELRFAASLGFARMPDSETLRRAERGRRHKG